MASEEGSNLVDFVVSMGGEKSLRVEENFGDGFVKLRVSEAERRQAQHDIRCIEDVVVEMLRNSRDAGARHIYVATYRDGDTRYLTMLDDGSGIPESMQDRVFDARVTSKLESVHMDRWGVHGRGMALFSVRMNAVSAEVMDSAPGAGTAIRVLADCNTVPERRDQSSYPVIERGDDDGGYRIASGPHNIIRTVLEFALEEASPTVYLGSPSEICAALIERGSGYRPHKEPAFSAEGHRPKLVLGPANAADAVELARIASSLGLELSERTAYRVLRGDIAPAIPLLEAIETLLDDDVDKEREHEGASSFDPFKDRRGLKIAADDLETFSEALQKAFATIAGNYYLSLQDKPSIKVGKDHITVRFDIEKES